MPITGATKKLKAALVEANPFVGEREQGRAEIRARRDSFSARAERRTPCVLARTWSNELCRKRRRLGFDENNALCRNGRKLIVRRNGNREK